MTDAELLALVVDGFRFRGVSPESAEGLAVVAIQMRDRARGADLAPLRICRVCGESDECRDVPRQQTPVFG